MWQQQHQLLLLSTSSSSSSQQHEVPQTDRHWALAAPSLIAFLITYLFLPHNDLTFVLFLFTNSSSISNKPAIRFVCQVTREPLLLLCIDTTQRPAVATAATSAVTPFCCFLGPLPLCFFPKPLSNSSEPAMP